MVQERIMIDDIWIDAFMYEGLYKVSISGLVMSLKRRYVLTDKILKPYNKKFYLEVGLSKGSPRIQANIRVHKLVWESFNGRVTKGFTINHIDGNKHNNNLDNLELLTLSDNTKDAWSRGAHKRGLQNHTRKLTFCDILKIRNSKKSAILLASIFKVSRQTINNVINKKYYYDIRTNEGTPKGGTRKVI